MTTRRDFVKKAGLGMAALALNPTFSYGQKKVNQTKFTSKRPPLDKRHFTSQAVEQTIARVKPKIQDEKLAWMFENCFPNTLDTTVRFAIKNGVPDTFVITGDIDAMWLRDSSAQVWPYLALSKNDAQLRQLLAGVIHRQTECILIDPYANAFNPKPIPNGHWMSDNTDMKPELHERKWEIDSLCYPVRLAYNYWKVTGDTSVFTTKWENAAKAIIKTFKEQQRKENHGPYKFLRETDRQLDTLNNGGFGNPVNPVGLIVSSFRPSDDATTFGFLVPSNFFAVISLKQISEIARSVRKNSSLANEASTLANEVGAALKKYTINNTVSCGNIYAFEVDGFGNQYLMDDANVPSLLAMPYLESIALNDPIYQNTRKFIWSTNNPYFFTGKVGHGIGGPHVGYDMIWPMSIIMHAMTSINDTEIKEDLKMLRDTDAGTGFMHESFNKDNPERFSRSWFAWVNTLFGELILKLEKENKMHLTNIN